jgi:hypothetical protein
MFFLSMLQEDPASGIPASVNRPKRFPGLAPWLIAELPTWVHTPPTHPAPAPAGGVQAAAAAGETAEAVPASAKTSPTSSSSSSRGGKVQPGMQHLQQQAPTSEIQRTSSTHSVTSDISDTSSNGHDCSHESTPPYLSSSSNMEVDAAVSVVPASHKPSTGVTGPDPGDTGIQLSHLHRPSPVQQQGVPDEQSAQEEDHDMSNR